MRMLFEDTRYAVRQLRRSPGFAVAALLTLGLGIGSVAAVFSVVYSVLLRPYGFDRQGQLVVWHEMVEEWKSSAPSVPANYKHYLMFKARAHAIADAAILERNRFSVSPGGQAGAHPAILEGLETSPELFSVLGVRPALGRDFLPQEMQAGRDGEVMLGYAAWQRLFQGSPAILGQQILVDGRLRTVIGILPQSFRFPPLEVMDNVEGSGSTELYQLFVPLVVSDAIKAEDTADFNYLVVARLRPGASSAAAQAEMNGLEAANGIANHLPIHVRVALSTLAEEANGRISTALWLLLAATGGVLLIACVNLANLQLARSVARQRDMAMRAALGAGRARMLQAALAESVVLAAAGGALGVALAVLAVRLTAGLAPPSLPRINELAVSWPVLLAAVGMAGATAVLFGVFPALASLRFDPQQCLQTASANVAGRKGGRGARRLLVAFEVALSVALLAVAGLAGRSLMRVMTENRHFTMDHVLLAEADLTTAAYGGSIPGTAPSTAELQRRQAFVDGALRRLRALPGVTTVGVTSVMPLTGDSSVQALTRPEHPLEESLLPLGNQRLISPGYLAAMEIPLVAGRDFDEQDVVHPGTAIVSERAAKAAWPDVNPIGHKLGRWDQQFTIIGITADARINDLKRDVAVFYLPFSASPQRHAIFVIRSSADPAALIPVVRSALWSIDPQAALPTIAPFAEQVSGSIVVERMQTVLFSGFGAAALLLAALGVYGVLAYSVSLRRREFGVRMALGSPRSALSRIVLTEAAGPVALGLVAGLGLATLEGRWLRSLLYETAASDPLVLGASVLLLAAAALAAALLPARRAAATDPMLVLREY